MITPCFYGAFFIAVLYRVKSYQSRACRRQVVSHTILKKTAFTINFEHMKKIFLFLAIPVLLFSCNNDQKVATDAQPPQEAPDFFPVTSYIKGQIAEIKSAGINPLKIMTANNKTDSAWLKIEAMDSAFAEFLRPEIDSANLSEWFRETKFMDRTLNTYTFTYEPKKELPATMALRRWDVYVNPQTGRVVRIYIEKSGKDKQDIQLNWQSNGSSKVVYIGTDPSGKPVVEKEALIKWNFDLE